MRKGDIGLNQNYSVIFTRRQNAELQKTEYPQPARDDEILGRTLVSIISNGSETGGFMGYGGSEGIYPTRTGYANIMEVLEVGPEVTDIHPGDRVFTLTSHQLYNKARRRDVFYVPEDIPVEKAVICRFPAVSMSAFLKSSIKPTEPALVTGLGVVGLMCAQMLRRNGFDVYCTDVSEARRKTAAMCGLEKVAGMVADFGVPKKTFGLAMDCSGNDQAIFSCVEYIRQDGELMLVGVPWLCTSDKTAHDFLREIFYSFLHVYSGFEWSLPRYSGDFDPNSNMHSMECALEWIRDGSIRVDGIYELFHPQDCSTLYPRIAAGGLNKPCAIFDWRLLEE